MALYATGCNFSNRIDGYFCSSYVSDNRRNHSLYDLAVKKFWRVGDAPWQTAFDRNRSPFLPAFESFAGFGEYDALPSCEKAELGWRRHRREISDILHGEQGAMLLAAQLVVAMPHIGAKLFASSQVADEARHVEFFSRYLLEIAGGIDPPSEPVRLLIAEMVSEERWDYKLIACQILLESIALGRLQVLRMSTRVPVLKFGIDYISRDEARHVHFGTDILRAHIAQLSDQEVEARSDYVLERLLRLASTLCNDVSDATLKGWDPAAVRRHLRQHRLLRPQLRSAIFRHLSLNLSATGLMTEKTRQRITSIEPGFETG
jgi:hypothetical protein